jgi:hypothetical protein
MLFSFFFKLADKLQIQVEFFLNGESTCYFRLAELCNQQSFEFPKKW